jgi:hypothetical protein
VHRLAVDLVTVSTDGPSLARLSQSELRSALTHLEALREHLISAMREHQSDMGAPIVVRLPAPSLVSCAVSSLYKCGMVGYAKSWTSQSGAGVD